MGHYRTALTLLEQLPESPERDRRELPLRMRHGWALIHAHGYGAAEAGNAFDRAWNLTRALDLDVREQYEALSGVWQISSSRGGFFHSVDVGKRLLQLAETHPSPLARVQGHVSLGNPLVCLGRFREARGELERGIAFYRAQPSASPLESAFNEDPGVACLSFLAWGLWHEGLPEQAAASSEEAVALARRLKHTNTLCYALVFAMHLHWLRREPEAVRQLAEEAAAIAEAHGFGFWRVLALIHIAWYEATHGVAGNSGFIESLSNAACSGMPSMEPAVLGPVTEAFLALEDTAQAQKAIERAEAAALRWDTRFRLAEIHRLRARLLTESAPGRAREELTRAIAISRQQGALMPELRAQTDLCRLEAALGEKPSLEALREVHGRFSEGFQNPDLLAAAELLD